MNKREDLGSVLVVDDHEPALYAKARVLRDGGYRVIERRSGAEVIDAVQQHRPDVVLLDVKLPGLDGYEVCRLLRSDPQTAMIVVIHTSASFTASDDRAHGLEVGADAYLVAPIEPRVLLATVGSFMRARKAEKALRASENRFRAVADAAPVMIWISDPAQNRVWLNQHWLDFTGRKLEEELGQRWKDRVHPEDLQRCEELARSAYRERRAFKNEYRLRSATGDYRWLLEHGVPITGSEEEFSGFVGSSIDITDRHAVEESRARLLSSERAARTEAERVNRMKDEFLATLSHELRTPLNAVLGWAQVLMTDSLDETQQRQGIETIERNARAQARIIEDLLDMSRIISGKIRLEVQPTDVRQVLLAALDAVSPAAKAKRILLSPLDDAEPLTIQADPNRLQQIVWNLLTNAIKFTPAGGRVAAVVRREEGAIEIEISDSGKGVDPAEAAHIFERFWQADASKTRAQGGLGLGLSIVKSLVELHGGTIGVQSPGPGLGTTFTVRLPAEAAAISEEAIAHRESRETRVTRSGETRDLSAIAVLVVDDDADSRAVVERILSERGAIVRSAASGEEALAMLAAAKADVLISDIGMPDLDGFELVRRVRALGSDKGGDIPAIAVTAFARRSDVQNSLEAGYQAHLAKPVDAQELIAVVADVTGVRSNNDAAH